MTPTRWQRVQDLVSAALELPEGERERFLGEVCGSNLELRRQIAELIASYEQAGDFLQKAVGVCAEEAVGDASPSPGERIGAYQITSVIGHGGMGTVYRAARVDDQFRQEVAIKVMLAGFGATSELLTRFRVERQILASLTHPNIARLLDGGITGEGLPYLVMEYIEGSTIEHFTASAELSIRKRLELFRQVCAAVQYAHQNLIVHRDIKPANVLVTEDGTPKLLDFGIAKLLSADAVGQTVAWTRPAERLMTPEYASPEQLRGETITTATDVYGLGALLYELLTGKRPFQTANLTPANIERLICESSPERPSTRGDTARRTLEGSGIGEPIPTELDNIVFKAMHKEPARRYTSVAELSEDVRRYLEGFPIMARADSWRYRARKFISRHQVATASAVLFFFITTGLSVSLAMQARRAAQQATRATREAETANQVAGFLGSLFESSRPDETQGRSTSAREILDRGANRITKELKGQPLVEARLLNTLGSVYYTLGALDRADALLKQAYEIRSRLLGPETPEAGETLRTMAWIASDRGRYQQAAKYFDQLLSIYRKTRGQNSPEVAAILSDSGLLDWTMGDLKDAAAREREALATWTAIRGATDSHTLTAKNNLVLVLTDEGDYAAAEALAREVLATRLRVLGPNHPNVATAFNNLALILGKTGRLEEAETAERKSLRIARQTLGPEHPAIANRLICLSWLERLLGRYGEAQQLGEEALRMSVKQEGEKSGDAAGDEDQLGLAMLAKGDVKRARDLLQGALATRAAAFGNSRNPRLAASYDHVGLMELKTMDLGAAQRNIEQGLAMRVGFYGHDNDNVATSLNDLGEVLAAEGNYAAAERQFREAIRIGRGKFPGGHAITADGLFGLGRALQAEGRLPEARAALREALEIRRKLLPTGHPDIEKSEAALRHCDDTELRAGGPG